MVTSVPAGPPGDDDGTGEAEIVFYSPSKSIYAFDRSTMTWVLSSGGGGTGEHNGAPLSDANQTLQPGTDTASEYVQPATAPLTAARTKILGVTSVVAYQLVRIIRKDTGAFNVTIANGGTNGGNLTTTLPPATTAYWPAFTAMYNGVDWISVGFEYLAAS